MKARILLTLFSIFLLAACQPIQLEEGGLDNETDLRVPGVNYATPNPLGSQIYEQQCKDCHGADGSLPQGSALIACTDCTNLEDLTKRIADTMPPNNAQTVSGADAAAVAEFVIAKFNYVSSGTASVNIDVDDIAVISDRAAAYKLAFDVKAQLPTPSEAESFSNNEGSAVLDQWLNSEAFYERVASIYNLSLRTDSFHSKFDRETNYRRLRDTVYACKDTTGTNCNSSNDNRIPYYPSVQWWDDQPSENFLAELTNNAFASEPLELIKYVLRENKPFSEILTADYVMVNAYSARAYGALNLDGSPISMDQFNEIPYTTEIIDVDGMSVEQISLNGLKQILSKLNRLGSNETKLNPGNDNDARLFLTTFGEDPRHYIPAKLKQGSVPLPHAGILSTKAFLNKFTTTPTNLQRARARWVYKVFAATDLLAIEGNRDASLIDFSDSIGAQDPTKTNEDCVVCHQKMDPVAAAFKNWTHNGSYQNYSILGCSVDSDIDHCGLAPNVGIGFGLEPAPATFGDKAVDAVALQWLGHAVTQSNLFSRSVAQNLFEEFTGDNVLELDLNKNDQYQKDYQLQQKVINAAILAFNNEGKDLRAAAKTILLSPYYLAQSSSGQYNIAGSDRLLTPEEIQLKMFATTKHTWSDIEIDARYAMDFGNRSAWRLYGGADGINTQGGPEEQGSMMYLIQERLANETACLMTAQEFARPQNSRAWLDALPFQAAKASQENIVDPNLTEQQIRQALVKMHLVFWHVDVSANSPEVNTAFNLYQSVALKGLYMRAANEASAFMDTHCRLEYHPDSNELLDVDDRYFRDEHYVIRAWAAVTAYFLSDYRFSHL